MKIPIARLTALPGATPPPEVHHALLSAAWRVDDIDLSLVLRDRVGIHQGVFVWVGERWAEGVSLLQGMGAAVTRASTVLVGEDPPPTGIGALIRQCGGLSWWRRPFDAWMLPPIAEALRRLAEEPLRPSRAAQLGVQQSLGQSPESVLLQVARVAQELLGADLSLAALLPQDDTEFLVLVPGERGIRPQRWDPTAHEWNPPANLSRLTIERAETVVVPDGRRAPSITPYPMGQLYRGALSIPVAFGHSGTAEEPAVLNLYWREPFLPTAPELDELAALARVAGAAWARRPDRHRIEAEHRATIEALMDFSRLPEASRQPRGLQAALSPFLTQSIQLYARSPGLVDLWVGLCVPGETEPSWTGITEHAPRPPPQLPAVMDEGWTTEGGGERVLSDLIEGLTAVITRVVPRAPLHTNEPIRAIAWVMATFDSAPASEDGVHDVGRLSDDLRLAIQLARRASDSEAVVQISATLARAADPREALEQVAQVIARQLSADGAKVFLRTSRDGEPGIQQVYRTGMGRKESRVLPLDAQKGLADWVLAHDHWAIARHPNHPGDPDPTWVGDQGQWLPLQVRPSGQYWEEPVPDDERHQIFVPLHHEGRAAGVLAVWRRAGEGFDTTFDIDSLRLFADHVSAACVRVMALHHIEAENRAMGALARKLSADRRPMDALHDVLEAVISLSACHHAITLHHDQERVGHFLYRASWSRSLPENRDIAWARQLNVEAGSDPAGWGQAILDAFLGDQPTTPPPPPPPGYGGPDGAPSARGALVPTLSGWLRDRPGDPVRGVILTLCPEGVRGLGHTFSGAFRDRYVQSFITYSGSLLPNHLGSFIQWAVDTVGEVAARGGSPEEVLETAAERLQDAVGTSVVIVYFGDRDDLTITAWAPATQRATLSPLPGSPGLSRAAMERGESLRIIDASDSRDPLTRQLNHEGLEALRRRAGWTHPVRSVLTTPLLHQGHSLGVLKVVTPTNGPFLTEEHARLVEAVARRAASEAARVLRQRLQDALNQISHGLTGFTGAELGEATIRDLQPWVRRYLRRPGATVALIATTHDGQALLRAPAALPALDRLYALSQAQKGQVVEWDVGAHLPDRPSPAGLGMPLRLHGRPQLGGHLFVLDGHPFRPLDHGTVQEAAREVSILLHSEIIADEARFQEGLFRHAVLGPVQGLTSSAKRLAQIMSSSELKNVEVPKLVGRIAEETEILRLWRDTQRSYATLRQSRTLDVRPRDESLRKLVLRCVDRYREAFHTRGIEVSVDVPPGDLTFRFDGPMIDLALSNLLDNARKYAFHHREVTVDVRNNERAARIRVTDIGAEIPNESAEAIYEPGQRVDRRDPVRAIPGEGIGLFLSRAIALAHGGTLSHTCEIASHRPGAPDDRTPYKVTFTLTLPHGWKARHA
jgi:signal transduction histidine kinase